MKLDSEQTFWLRIWSLLGMIAIVIIVMIGSCTVHEDRCITKLITSGVSPIMANYAIRSNGINKKIGVYMIEMAGAADGK